MSKATAAALLLFVVLSLVLTLPLSLHLADAVEDRQDALLNVWITAWDGRQLLHDPLHLFDANIFSTYPRTLAYSELLLGNGLLALPITAATGNPVLGYNLALLLSFVLSGMGTYLLALKLTRSPGAGIVAGTILAFSAYRLTNLAQAQLLTTQWLPFALLALLLLLRQPRPRHVATFVLFFCLQTLSSFYYGILLALAAALLVICYWAVELRNSGSGIGDWLAGQRTVIVHLLVAAFLCCLIILPFALPYFQVQDELGFERTLADNEPFSASLRQYLMVPPGSVFHGLWLPSDDKPLAGGYPVDALFPGLVAMALAVWGLVRGQGQARWFFFLLLLIAFILSLGPRLYLAPGQPAGLELSLPYAWLYAIVPAFKALRAPARFDALVMLCLAVVAGYGVAALTESWSIRRSLRLIVPGILFLVLLESLVSPAAKVEPVPVTGDVPPVYRWLAEQPSGSILELPMAFTPGGPQLDYQYLSTYHWHTTPDGYSGFFPPKHGQVVYEMERFPSERSLSLLQALSVDHVIIHRDRYPAGRWSEMQSALAATAGLAPGKTFGPDRVYQVQPRAFDAGELTMSGYLPPRAAAGQAYTAYLIVQNAATRSYAVRPTDLVRPSITWEGAGSSHTVAGAPADIPLVTSASGGVSVIPLALAAPETPGTYQLTLGEEHGPLGAWTLAGTVEVGDSSSEPGAPDFPVPVHLAGWSLPTEARPDQALKVHLTWRALGKIDAYYSTYVKLFDAGGNAIAGWDGQPRGGEAPTLLWVPGETIDDTVVLTIPAGTPPGEYRVEVGMYRADDLARSLTLNEKGIPVGWVELGTVRIVP